MAENPLATIARLLGGVVLMDGRLGHQVLGQLLVMNTNEVAIAGASLVIAGTSGQRSAVGQAVVRTVIPALAVRALLQKAEKRIDRKAQLVSDREDDLDLRERELAMEERELERARHAALAERLGQAPAPPVVSPPVVSPPVVSPPLAPLAALSPAFPPSPVAPPPAAPARPKKRAARKSQPPAPAPARPKPAPDTAKRKPRRVKPPDKRKPRGRR